MSRSSPVARTPSRSTVHHRSRCGPAPGSAASRRPRPGSMRSPRRRWSSLARVGRSFGFRGAEIGDASGREAGFAHALAKETSATLPAALRDRADTMTHRPSTSFGGGANDMPATNARSTCGRRTLLAKTTCTSQVPYKRGRDDILRSRPDRCRDARPRNWLTLAQGSHDLVSDVVTAVLAARVVTREHEQSRRAFHDDRRTCVDSTTVPPDRRSCTSRGVGSRGTEFRLSGAELLLHAAAVLQSVRRLHRGARSPAPHLFAA